LVLEFWSEGIEHGHIHVHSHGDKKFPLTMMIGLCIHSFLEAMPLANGHHDSDHLLFAIVLHHIPIAIALMSMLMASHINRMQAVLYLMIFAAMPPLGALVSSFINQSDIWAVANFAPKIKAVVIGIFLHVSTTILFETDHDHRFNLKKLVIVILGASLAFIHF
jgi:zinc and cadmium transporter